MLTDDIDEHVPVHLDKQQPAALAPEQCVSEQQKMQLPEELKLEPPFHSDPHGTAPQSIPSVSTSGAFGEPSRGLMQTGTTSLTDIVKMEPDDDFVHYKVELIDMEAESSYKEGGPNPEELEPSAVQKPDTIEPAPETDPQKTNNKKQKAPRVKYSESYLEETINQVRNRTLTMYAAWKLTGIPRATMQYRMSSVFKNKGTRGPYTVFTKNEEKEIVVWIKDMMGKMFPITRTRMEYKVSNYLNSNPRKNPFKNNKPGKQWIANFVKRNPDVNVIKCPSVDVTEQDVRNWFRSVLRYLKGNQLADILTDPSRILNSNEAGFMLNPTSKGVAYRLYHKYVPFLETTNRDHNMTVMFTFVANGCFVPPHVVIPTKRLTQEMIQSFPSDWGLGKADNGRLDVQNFTVYIMKILYPTLVKRGTQFPVLYFVDGHNSDVTFEAADMCKQYGIILIALYPKAAQIIQQSNAGAFNQLKTTWDNVVRTWRLEHNTKRITLAIYASLLEEAMNKSLIDSPITNGFIVSGLYPFNINAINFMEYGNLFAANTASGNDDIAYTSNITDDTGELSCGSVGIMGIGDESKDRQIEVPESVLKTALRMLGPSKINLYQTTLADDLSQEDKVLSYVYKNILIVGETPAHDATQESVNKPSSSKTGTIWELPSLAPDDDDNVNLEFDATMDIKTEHDFDEPTEMIVGDCDYGLEKTTGNVAQETCTSGNCQQNEINSNYAGETSRSTVHFATEHICSFPRITVHFCPVANRPKYHSFFLDLTGMYIAYLDACQKTSQEPVSSKVFNEIVLKERTKDPPLPSRCDDCEHVEKYDLGELSCAFLNK